MKSLPKYLWGTFSPGESKSNWHQKELQLHEFLKEHPGDEEAILHKLSIVLGFQDKDDECIKVCERMLELNPDNAMKTEIYVALGRRHKKEKAVSKEEESSSKVLKLDPDCEEAATE